MSKLDTLLKPSLPLLEDSTPSAPTSPEESTPLSGQHIVVLDRGFVYVGDLSKQGDFLKIDNAKNIRRWGTTKGLGELRNGPLSGTTTDEVGTVLAPWKSIIHLIPSKGF